MINLRIFNTPVRIKPTVSLLVFAIWAGAAGLDLYWHPGRGFWSAVLIGFATMFLLILAEFGHPLAHIFSARFAGTPMSEIRITVTQMPHTLYDNNAASPNAHRLRALGGPIFNLLCLLLSVAVFVIAPAGSVAKELASCSTVAHSMMLIMSLAPEPIVDGGNILKWTLVARGWSEVAAVAGVRRAGWLFGIMAVVLGLCLIAMHVWIVGGIFSASGTIILGIAVGVVR